jgi:hypothetical protein
MQTRFIYLAIALIAMSVSFSVSANIRVGDKEVTIKGEVIDQPCYEGSNSKRGDTHKACALSCAKRGGQLAIVDEKNNVYSITGDYAANKNEKLIEFVAETVEVKGVVTEKDGKKSIALSAIKKAEAKEYKRATNLLTTKRARLLARLFFAANSFIKKEDSRHFF